MTKVLLTREIDVIFDNEEYNSSKGGPHYVVNIKVETMRYANGAEYFDISYKYRFIPGALVHTDEIKVTKRLMHPFYKNYEESLRGDIIFKNSMSSLMVDYLLMDDDTLSKVSGASTPQGYRANIMMSLSQFWD